MEPEFPSLDKDAGLVVIPLTTTSGVSFTRVTSGSSWEDVSEHLQKDMFQ